MADHKTIHLKLLTDISDNFDISSAEYENFIKHMTNYVAKGILSRNKTILNKLQCLETKGHLSPGQYDKLKKIAIDSENNDLIGMIEKAENDIKNVEKIEEGSTSKRRREDEEVTSSESTCKRSRDDDADPLYRRDNFTGKSYYETEGKKGLLLILNSTTNRKNTDKDVENIKTFFEDTLRFHIFDPRSQESDDLTTEKLTSCLESAKEKISGELSSEYYCFVCIILSHGDENGIATRDGIKPVNEIVKMFSDCFIGKPKLFFIQACRGLNTTSHEMVDDEADDNAVNGDKDDITDDESDEIIKIPHGADTLVAYATIKGAKAFRRDKVGSWFISKMIEEFRKNYSHDHVEEMLISVRETVACMYSANCKSMQMPCVESTLTRRLQFKKL